MVVGKLDWTTPTTSSSQSSSSLNRNVFIGTALGITASALLLTKGKLKNLPKMNYGVKEVMAICAGSTIGGYTAANLTTKDNFKGRTLELKNELIFNDFIPLMVLKGADLLIKTKNKLAKSIALAGTLLGATIVSHKVGENNLKKKGLNPNYPVKACHLLADFDDFLLPIAIATKSKWLQQFLKIISPITFAPLGINVGTTKDSKYYSSVSSSGSGSSVGSSGSSSGSGSSVDSGSTVGSSVGSTVGSGVGSGSSGNKAL